MKCDKCNVEIKSGEEIQHLGENVCEDCYMDILSPVRSCDPWSTHSAKTFEKHMGTDSATFSSIQSEIIKTLKETGEIGEEDLLEKLEGKIDHSGLIRELSTLRHMEKIGAKRQGDQIIWQIWKL